MSQPSRAVTAGIDLGGTATRAVVLRASQVLAHDTTATRTLGHGTPGQRARRLWDVLAGIIPQGCRIRGLGIGASGPIDPSTGIIDNPATLPRFTGFDLAAQLAAIAEVPVVIENDAVTAAIGEYHCGAGRGSARMLQITLGTGIGVALLLNGAPFRQADGRHPEAGHLPASASQALCYCGLVGCWEPDASRKALEHDLAYLQTRFAAGQLIDGAAQLARDGDPQAALAFNNYGQRVGRGLTLLHSVYGPDLAVVGGSVSVHLDMFRSGLEQGMQRATGFALNVPVVAASLGSHAGAIGAAILASNAST